MKLKDFLTLKVGAGVLISGTRYSPLINYDWSTTTTSGLRYLKDVGSTPTYNASMYFGRGAYLNGVDQSITVPINTTIQTALKRVKGVVTINETSQTLTNYVISGLGVHKDYYLFTRLLTTTEKDSYTSTPEAFYAMAQADDTCVLNMPMCETSSTVRNYKTGIDYPITNYTSSVRDNAKNLQYGLQTCKFVRNSLGVIQSTSNYLECDGVGYIKTQWVPNGTDVFTLETVITPALVSKLQAHGNYGTSINEIQIGVTASNLVFASSLNSETVYLPYTENMHVCIVSDGVQSYYYCNNVLIKTTYNNSGSTINPFAFGGVNSGTIFNPTYDTLRLFKIHAIAYTSSQVDAAYYALAKKNTIAYDVIPDECLYDENGNVYIDERGNYIGVDGYVMDESGEYYIV